MNKKLYRYIDHICNKMGFIRKIRDFFKQCPSKASVKLLVRKYKEECRRRNKSAISFEEFIMGPAMEKIAKSIEDQCLGS